MARIVGTSPLIACRKAAKVKNEILAKQLRGAKPPKAARHRENEAIDAAYLVDADDPTGTCRYDETDNVAIPTERRVHCWPVIHVKKAMQKIVSATVSGKPSGKPLFIDGISGAAFKTIVFVEGEWGDLVRLDLRADSIRLEEDLVKVGMGADVRFRTSYWPWAMEFRLTWNANTMNKESIANILQLAGEYNGLGDRRPQREGLTYGQFVVEHIEGGAQ
jgi:hypothetical protein